MSAKKGCIPWNKGITGYSTSLKGRKRTKIWCKRLSESHKGDKNPMFGKKRPNHSKRMLGENNPSKRPEIREKQRIRRQKEVLILNNCMQIGKNETRILDELELSLNKKIIRQKPVCGYWLDGYIPELNLVIEVDEEYHIGQKEKDLVRQKNIQERLNCDFVRVLCVE